jgi:large subunit ribosomal protein L28
MTRACDICGKRVAVGNKVSHRGLAKHKGGVGIKTTGVSRRTFRPNIHKMRVQVGGGVKRLKVCTQCLRSGRVAKPVKRTPRSGR